MRIGDDDELAGESNCKSSKQVSSVSNGDEENAGKAKELWQAAQSEAESDG